MLGVLALRSFRNILKKYSDWVFLVILLVLVSIVGVCAFVLFRSDDSLQNETQRGSSTYKVQDSDLFKTEPPDSKYPPPAKEQASFYKSYTVREIQFSIAKGNKNVDRIPDFGPNTFYVTWYNYANKEVNPSGDYLKSISIGCTALDNPYRAITFIPTPLTFKPYEEKKITLEVDVFCMYLGTADGKYYWRGY